ncbi:hypothetical protein [Rhodoferax sp.]|uniref:hypothetical protein n=1 Tax=Rhodoferax sp. TaxID=50421 RepID=UPI0039B8F0F3
MAGMSAAPGRPKQAGYPLGGQAHGAVGANMHTAPGRPKQALTAVRSTEVLQ